MKSFELSASSNLQLFIYLGSQRILHAEKFALLREKLSMVVKKGKGLVQDRENLKHQLDEKNFEIEKLRLQIYNCCIITKFSVLQLLALQSEHDLKDKSQLIYLIQKYLEGIAITNLKDSYPTVMEDFRIPGFLLRWMMTLNYYSVELNYLMICLILRRIFKKNGMKPTTNTTERRAHVQVQGISAKAKPKKKKHEISKRTKLTNAHLPELFQNLK
ncbi:hypothetical protein UlMin_008732 [Ulmus minor]